MDITTKECIVIATFINLSIMAWIIKIVKDYCSVIMKRINYLIEVLNGTAKND